MPDGSSAYPTGVIWVRQRNARPMLALMMIIVIPIISDEYRLGGVRQVAAIAITSIVLIVFGGALQMLLLYGRGVRKRFIVPGLGGIGWARPAAVYVVDAMRRELEAEREVFACRNLLDHIGVVKTFRLASDHRKQFLLSVTDDGRAIVILSNEATDLKERFDAFFKGRS